jgi:hypothetical protein
VIKPTRVKRNREKNCEKERKKGRTIKKQTQKGERQLKTET